MASIALPRFLPSMHAELAKCMDPCTFMLWLMLNVSSSHMTSTESCLLADPMSGA